MIVRWRILAAGILSLVVLAGLYARPSVQLGFVGVARAEALGVGVFSGATRTTLYAPVAGAGAAGGLLDTSITAFISSSQVTLANAASTTVGPSATVWWGRDDTAAIQAALNALITNVGGTLFFPKAIYWTSATLTIPNQ